MTAERDSPPDVGWQSLAVDGVEEGIVLFDHEGRLRHANEAARGLLPMASYPAGLDLPPVEVLDEAGAPVDRVALGARVAGRVRGQAGRGDNLLRRHRAQDCQRCTGRQ